MNLLFELSKNDFKLKYAGSAGGLFWAFFKPFSTLFIYWFVNELIFKQSFVGGVSYVMWLISGLIPWFFITDSLNSSSIVFSDYSYLVKKVNFETKILPYMRVFSAFIIHVFLLSFALILGTYHRINLGMFYFQLIYYMLCGFAFNVSLALTCSVFSLVLKDFASIIEIFLQFGFWITPIFWNFENLSGKFVWLLKLNPINYLVQGFRDTLIFKRWFFQDIHSLVYFWSFVLVLFYLSRRFFNKVKPYLPDL